MPHSVYQPERMGHAAISPEGSFTAGSNQSFTLVYTAGYFGIDDSGSLKIVQRYASDMGKLQFDEPDSVNFVTVEASNGATLDVRYEPKLNIRPWDKTLFIRVVRGYLKEGDQIVVRFGDPRNGSPGMRLQTFCEDSFEFKVLVDAFATYEFVEILDSPTISIVPGPPTTWKAALPTLVQQNKPFCLKIKCEDRWGNPSNLCNHDIFLSSNLPIKSLPKTVAFPPGEFAISVDDLSADQPGNFHITLSGKDNVHLTTSNALRVATNVSLNQYWGDLHGQSEETVGTGSALEYFQFARDRAFLDVCCHQGNDFQITNQFWRHLNQLTRNFNEEDRFVIFPGYEWSGNTGLGGDRNVLFLNEDRQIHRSSHALVRDLSDIESDANSADDLFSFLKKEDCIVLAHVGGRYADIKLSHDIRLESAVEIHSAWGTFEWILHDALEMGYRVGIVGNSDDHKGRPGASYPGASTFGAYGGLTCMLATNLSRTDIAKSLRKRHHYATSGCRMYLDVRVNFENQADLYEDDPNLKEASSQPVFEAIMGDILRCKDESFDFSIDAVGSAPIERVEIRDGENLLETYRPFGCSDLGRRIRVVWEGSEYRGRGRQTNWDGRAIFQGNKIERVEQFNAFNLEKKLTQHGSSELTWTAITTGGFGGFDTWLTDPQEGQLIIETPLIHCEVPISDIGLDDLVFDAGGLGRRLRIYRLPEINKDYAINIERNINLKPTGDTALFVRITQEDGHFIWSSPIYLFR